MLLQIHVVGSVSDTWYNTGEQIKYQNLSGKINCSVIDVVSVT